MGWLELGLFFFLVAFVPPLLFVWWVRETERHRKEPVGALLRVFVAGAVLAVLLALLLEVAFDYSMERQYEGIAAWVPYAIFTSVVVAPLAEEFSKGVSVLAARARRAEPEDGLVYGAAAGFGFAATENLLYGGSAFALGGVGAYVATTVLRTVAATLLHASASAWAGHGLLEWRSGRRSPLFALGMFALAVFLHAAYNLLASFGVLVSLAAAVAFSVFAFRAVRKRVERLDRAAP